MTTVAKGSKASKVAAKAKAVKVLRREIAEIAVVPRGPDAAVQADGAAHPVPAHTEAVAVGGSLGGF